MFMLCVVLFIHGTIAAFCSSSAELIRCKNFFIIFSMEARKAHQCLICGIVVSVFSFRLFVN